MKNKLSIILILSIIILMTNCCIVKAVTSASGGTVNSGEEITVTITSSVSLSGYTVSVRDSGECKFKSVSVPSGVVGEPNGMTIGGLSISGTTTLATYKFTAPTVTTDKKCSISFSVTGIVNANNEDLNNENITATVTVKAPKVETPPAETTPTPPATQPNTPTAKSSEARLKNLGIRPNDFKGFSKNKTTYDVEVPNDVDKIEIYAEPVDSKATIKGTGNVNLKVGDNKFEVTVTAEDGKTKKTYKLNVIRLEKEEESTAEARLKTLGIKPEEYDFSGFKRDNTSYSVEVPSNLEEVEIYAETVSSKAKINGLGKVSLKEGENKFEITVTAEDGTTKKIYTLNITRISNSAIEVPNTEEPTKIGLKSLTIKDLNFSPKFNTNTYEYTVGLTKDLSSLEIETIANMENAIVEIIGNENLQQGENIITILVSYPDSEEVATYQLIVNKNVIDNSVVGKVEWSKPSTWGLKEKIIVGVVISLLIIIVVVAIIKFKLSREVEEEYDFPGADELDKALTEHQELSEDEDFEYNENYEENMQYNEDETYEKDASYDDEAVYLKSTRNNIGEISNNSETEHIFSNYSKGKHF